MNISLHPTPKRPRTTTDDQENATPHSFSDALLAHYQSKYDEKMKEMGVWEKKHQELEEYSARIEGENGEFKMEISQMKEAAGVEENLALDDVSKRTLQRQIRNLEEKNADLVATVSKHLEKISELSNKQDKSFNEDDDEVQIIEEGVKQEVVKQEVVEEAKISPEPLTLKKLVKLKEGICWHGNKTLNDDEEPIEICLIDDKYLLINGVVAPPAKKLVLDDEISFFNYDPFERDVTGYENTDWSLISNLLSRVDTAVLTNLQLCRQNISWKDYLKLVDSGEITNCFFFDVEIKEVSILVPLEKIMENLPVVEKFRYDVIGSTGNIHDSKFFSVTIETFKNLVKLPVFNNLRKFVLNDIVYKEFDADGFIEFMKKHPLVHFSLSFYGKTMVAKSKQNFLKILKSKLIPACPTPGRLQIKFN